MEQRLNDYNDGEARISPPCPLDADAAVDAEIAAKLRGRRTPVEYGVLGARCDDPVFDVDAVQYWGNAIAGVTLAGGCYGLPFFVVGALVLGLATAILCCALVVPFVVAVRTITGRWLQPLAGPAFGGVVGFVATAPAWGALVEDIDSGVAVFVLGPMTTTLLGQTGGYLATRKLAYVMALGARNRLEERWRFTIRALLVTTAWVALAATILRVLGLATRAHGIAIGIWLLWQAGLLWFWSWRIRRALDSPRRFRLTLRGPLKPMGAGRGGERGALHVERAVPQVRATTETYPDGST
jgi:hypothetical protein